MKGSTQVQQIHSICPSQYSLKKEGMNYTKDIAQIDDVSKQNFMIMNPNSHQQRVSSNNQQENMSSYRSNQSTSSNINPEQYMSPQQFQQYQMGLDKKMIFCQSPTLTSQQQQINRQGKDGRIQHQSSDIRRIPTNEYLISKQSQEGTRVPEKVNLNGQNILGQKNSWEQNYQQKFPVTNSMQQKFKVFEVVENTNERSDRHEINETRQIQNKIENLNSIQDKFKIQLQYKSTASSTQSSALEAFKMSPKNNNQMNYGNQNNQNAYNINKEQDKKIEFFNQQYQQHFNVKGQQNNILKDSKQVNVFNKEQHQTKIMGIPPNPPKTNVQQQQQPYKQQNDQNGFFDSNSLLLPPQTPNNSSSQQNNSQNFPNQVQKPPLDQNNQLLINNPNMNVNDFKMNHLMFKNNPFASGEVKLVKNINACTTPKESNNKNSYTTQNSLNNIDFKISATPTVQQEAEKNESNTNKQNIINRIDMGRPIHKATKSIFNTSSTTAQISNKFNTNERRSFHSNVIAEPNNSSQQTTNIQGDSSSTIQQNNKIQQININPISHNTQNNSVQSNSNIPTNNFSQKNINYNQHPAPQQQQQQQQPHNQQLQNFNSSQQTNGNNSSQQQLQQNPQSSQQQNQILKQNERQPQNTLKYMQNPISQQQPNQSHQNIKQQQPPMQFQSQNPNQQSLQHNNNQRILQNALPVNNIQLNQQNSIKTPSSNQQQQLLNEEIKLNDDKLKMYRQGSAEKPQIHLNSLNKIAPKNIGDQQGGGPNSHKYNINLNQVNNQPCKPSSSNLKFPQPAHFDRDSFKSKRSSVQSQTGRSDIGSINNETIKTQNNNNNSNNNYDSLNYEKISQQNDKTTILDQIKEMSDNFFTKTQKFFQNNFKKINSRLGCSCDINLKADGTCSNAYQWLFKVYKKEELDKLKAVYEGIKNSEVPDMEQNMLQIEKDLSRTFPQLEMFQNEKHINSLRNLLQAIAKLESNIGYVQGMNMIAASLLYHAEEYISFWIMKIIFDKLEMRDIYKPSKLIFISSFKA